MIDRRRGCAYDFWQARRRRGRWTASWANALPLDSRGVFPRGLSARGSGFALLGGLILPWELRRGRIDHALVWSYAWPSAGGPVPPATESDGASRRPGAIPEGARIRLDPSIDLSRLRLRPYERTIARALQDYGAYLADVGSGFAVYALNPTGRRTDPYRGSLPKRAYPSLDRIPIESFQVLRPPTGRPRLPVAIIPNGCNHFR